MTVRFDRTVARACIFAASWLLMGTLTAVASAPSFNSDLAGAPRLRATNEAASLAITVRTCPAGYDPTSSDADYARDCRQPAGDTTFQLDQGNTTGPTASTGTSGDAPQQSTVTFSGLAAGKYIVTAVAPPEIEAAFIGSCASDARQFDSYPISPFANVFGGRISIELLAGENLTCHWYQVMVGPS